MQIATESIILGLILIVIVLSVMWLARKMRHLVTRVEARWERERKMKMNHFEYGYAAPITEFGHRYVISPEVSGPRILDTYDTLMGTAGSPMSTADVCSRLNVHYEMLRVLQVQQARTIPENG